jgi:hypothetical protein
LPHPHAQVAQVLHVGRACHHVVAGARASATTLLALSTVTVCNCTSRPASMWVMPLTRAGQQLVAHLHPAADVVGVAPGLRE